MSKKIMLTKTQQVLLKIILSISSFFLTCLLSNRYKELWILIGALLALLISTFIIIKFVNIKEIDIKTFMVSLLISIYEVAILSYFLKNNVKLLQNIIFYLTKIKVNTQFAGNLLEILAIPAFTFIIYISIDKYWKKVKQFFKSLTKNEKKYLYIMTIIGIVSTITLSYFTTAFTQPVDDNEILYDIIYTTDSISLTHLVVSYTENDIRQPLFGVFAMPFSISAMLISKILFFLPDNNAYDICLTIIQFFLTTITTIMIARMLKLEENDKKYLYILFSCSFPYILFNIVLEQYVIAVFYLILAIYIHFEIKPKGINYFYIPAVGTLLTSGIIFPIITKFRKIKQWLIDISKCFLAFISTIIISGQFPQGLELIERYYFFSTRFVGKISLYKKICQFTNFIKGIFIAVPGRIVEVMGYPSYQLINIKTVSIIGIIILIICIISFIINHKNKFCYASILWIAFSILILLIIGWGTKENGLILYSLYFAWAYLTLYFMFIKKIIKNRKVFVGLILLSSAIMLTFNMIEFINIIKFAIKFY